MSSQASIYLPLLKAPMSAEESSFNAKCHSLLSQVETSKGEPKLKLLVMLFNFVNAHLERMVELSRVLWTKCAASFYYSVCRLETHLRAQNVHTITLLTICRDLKHSVRLYLGKLVASKSVLLDKDNKHISRALASLVVDPDFQL